MSFDPALFGAWLLEAYLAATVVLTAAWMTLKFVKQPVRRLAVARAAFLALAALPPLLAFGEWTRRGSGAEAGSTHRHSADLKTSESHLASCGCGAVTSEPRAGSSTTSAAIPGSGPPSLPILLFAVGSGLSVAWLGLGAVSAFRLRNRTREAPEAVRRLLEGVVGGRDRMPRLLVSETVSQPIALGALTPTIILPVRFVEEESASRIELALAHEWAHVRHGDLRLLTLSRLLLPLFFAHPLYAWLRAKVRADQEALADASAAEGAGRIAYAEALLQWARSDRGASLGLVPAFRLWERSSPLRARMTLLLDRDFRVETACPRPWRYAVRAVAFVLVLGCGFTTVSTASPVTAMLIVPPPTDGCSTVAPAVQSSWTMLTCPEEPPKPREIVAVERQSVVWCR